MGVASGEGEEECWFGEKDAMNRARWRVEVGELVFFVRGIKTFKFRL